MKSLLLLLLVSSSVFGQRLVIPHPAILQLKRGEFVVRAGLRVWYSSSCSSEQTLLKTYWQEAGFPALINTPKAKSANVVLSVDTTRREALGQEGYELIISTKRIRISGASASGVFYGLQTLRQLLPTVPNSPVQCIRILDKPRFGWRSFRLEEGRNARGVVAVRRLLDELALLKLNRFHWQSANGLYTQQQAHDVIRYAKERHITVTTAAEEQSIIASSKQTVRLRQDAPKDILNAANNGYSLVIVFPAKRLNSGVSIDGLYLLEPIPDQMPEDLRTQILGIEYEYRVEEMPPLANEPDRLQTQLAILAEIGWTFAQNKDLNRFKTGLAEFEKWWSEK